MYCFDFINTIVSVIALIISLATFIYTYVTNMPNFKVEFFENNFSFVKDDDKYLLYVKCELRNNSKNPINVSSIQLKLSSEKYPISALIKSIKVAGDDLTIHDQNINYNVQSIELPKHFESYDSLETTIVFTVFTYTDDPRLNYLKPQTAKIIFNTSRGKVKKTIDINKNI